MSIRYEVEQITNPNKVGTGDLERALNEGVIETNPSRRAVAVVPYGEYLWNIVWEIIE